MHTDPHPLKGQTIKVNLKAPHFQLQGTEYEFVLEDWWDHLTGKSWMFSDGNPAALVYAMRTGFAPDSGIPFDDDVVYGKIGSFGHLIHVSELVDA